MTVDMNAVQSKVTGQRNKTRGQIENAAAMVVDAVEYLDDLSQQDPKVAHERAAAAVAILRGAAVANADTEITLEQALAALPDDRVRNLTRIAITEPGFSVEQVQQLSDYASKAHKDAQDRQSGAVVDVQPVAEIKTAAAAVDAAANKVHDGSADTPFQALHNAIETLRGLGRGSVNRKGKEATDAVIAAYDVFSPLLNTLLDAAHKVGDAVDKAPTTPLPALQPPPAVALPSARATS